MAKKPLVRSSPAAAPPFGGSWGFMGVILVGFIVIGVIWLGLTARERNLPTGRVNREDVSYTQPLHASHQILTTAPGGTLLAEVDASSPQPEAVLDQRFYDFGRIRSDQVVAQSFVLANRGQESLFIRQAYTTCACTAADFSSAEVPPGKVSLITVTFDPRVHDVAGTTVRRGLIIETNDPRNPVLEVWVQATVR